MIQAASDTTVAVTAISALHPLVYVGLLVLTLAASAFLAYKAVLVLAKRGQDDTGREVSWALLKTFPSTNGVIAAGLGFAAFFIGGSMVADIVGRPVSQATQTTLSFLIAAMLGIGAGQFAAKRATDSEYQKAKNSHKGTTVLTPEANVSGSPVTVEEKG